MSDEISDDLDLVLRMMDGDEDALRELIRTVGGATLSLLKKKFGGVLDRQELEEAINVAAYKAYRFADRFDRFSGTLQVWFATIAIRAAQDILRSEQKHRHKQLEDDPKYDPAESDDGDASTSPVESRRIEILQGAIKTVLTAAERDAILADLASGEKADDTRLAQQSGRTKGSIQALRSKALKKLHDHLMTNDHAQVTNRGKR